ncbi:DUF6192 family protein [Streptomyces sp. NPDC057557]|uniref:DUF6192 family protein n=1 Tax=Streptomyces sp. NPDC057557 TaxID=3346167 RepID=UPI0036A98CDE
MGRRLFAHQQGANEQQFQQIAADGLAQMYFRANNSRAHGLGVEFTDVEREVSAIHALAQADEVVAEVSGDLMRRLAVASRFTSVDKVQVVELEPGW